MSGFLNELKVQRWDDHRYYHHSKVNQSLHFVSATSFLVAYVVAFSDPAMAALKMMTRAANAAQMTTLATTTERVSTCTSRSEM